MARSAQAIAAASKAGGGIITMEDFAKYKVRELSPVECDYRGYHVISAPPPSSGGVVLCEILEILQGYDLTRMGFHSADEVHFLVEAMRRAFVDRNDKLGDPDFVKNPVAELISQEHAAKLRAGIDPDAARHLPASCMRRRRRMRAPTPRNIRWPTRRAMRFPSPIRSTTGSEPIVSPAIPASC